MDANVIQHTLDCINLMDHQRVRCINDMDKDVSLDHFFKGRLERLHQMMRQFPDETYGVGQQGQLIIGKFKLPGCRIEGCKQLVIGQNPGVGQRINQRGFTGVGIADK